MVDDYNKVFQFINYSLNIINKDSKGCSLGDIR